MNSPFPNKAFPPTPYPVVDFIDPEQLLAEPPSLASMAASLGGSLKNWLKSGLQKTNEETLKARIEICKSCEFWNGEGFNGSGRCRKCGCSTWAKLRMATESCPIGKWKAVPEQKSTPEQETTKQ